MAEDPGRRLEPVQLDSLCAGRPAGPMLDKEFPPQSGSYCSRTIAAARAWDGAAKPKFIGILNIADVAAHAVQI